MAKETNSNRIDISKGKKDVIGFARVSTQQQDLTSQKDKLIAFGCGTIFAGKHSGKADSNKDALEELLAHVRPHDTVVVTKLDRLGRSLSQVLLTLDALQERDIKFVTIDQEIDTTKQDAMSKAMVSLLGMFAELERNFIVQRTTEGKEASGNFGGRKPKLTDKQRKEVVKRLKAGESKRQLAIDFDVSRGTIINIAKQAGLD